MLKLSDKYKLVGIKPGKIHHPRLGSIDFSQPVSESVLDQLYSEECPYIKKIGERTKSNTNGKK